MVSLKFLIKSRLSVFFFLPTFRDEGSYHLVQGPKILFTFSSRSFIFSVFSFRPGMQLVVGFGAGDARG